MLRFQRRYLLVHSPTIEFNVLRMKTILGCIFRAICCCDSSSKTTCILQQSRHSNNLTTAHPSTNQTAASQSPQLSLHHTATSPILNTATLHPPAAGVHEAWVAIALSSSCPLRTQRIQIYASIAAGAVALQLPCHTFCTNGCCCFWRFRSCCPCCF